MAFLLSSGCECSVSLPHGAVGWPVIVAFLTQLAHNSRSSTAHQQWRIASGALLARRRCSHTCTYNHLPFFSRSGPYFFHRYEKHRISERKFKHHNMQLVSAPIMVHQDPEERLNCLTSDDTVLWFSAILDLSSCSG